MKNLKWRFHCIQRALLASKDYEKHQHNYFTPWLSMSTNTTSWCCSFVQGVAMRINPDRPPPLPLTSCSILASSSLKVGRRFGDSAQHRWRMVRNRPFGMRINSCRSPRPMRQIWVSRGTALYGYSSNINS